MTNNSEHEGWMTVRRALMMQVRHIDQMDLNGLPPAMSEFIAIVRRSNLQIIGQINNVCDLPGKYVKRPKK